MSKTITLIYLNYKRIKQRNSKKAKKYMQIFVFVNSKFKDKNLYFAEISF